MYHIPVIRPVFHIPGSVAAARFHSTRLDSTRLDAGIDSTRGSTRLTHSSPAMRTAAILACCGAIVSLRAAGAFMTPAMRAGGNPKVRGGRERGNAKLGCVAALWSPV
jgi:hypothetical protein